MSWVKDLWQILETVATLTNEVERSHTEIKELRRDVNSLTIAVSQLKKDLENTQDTTRLILEKYKADIDYAKESIAAKFDVLTSRLDLKVAEFEHRLTPNQPESKTPRSLKSGREV